jgi:hypothetical protein
VLRLHHKEVDDNDILGYGGNRAGRHLIVPALPHHNNLMVMTIADPLRRLRGHAVRGYAPPAQIHEQCAAERGGDAAALVGVGRDGRWARALGLSLLSP